jgi:tRNA(Arg) A34 adenosine deaminase TadA
MPRALEVSLPDWLEEVVAPQARFFSPEERMRLVIRLARENVLRDSAGPFGAAVFDADSGEVVAAGVNRVVPLQSSLFHAEVLALLFAQKRLGTYRLSASGPRRLELVSSCEPCAMCLGAVFWSGARRLVYGATRDDAMAMGFDEGPVFDQSHEYLRERGFEILPPLLREEASAVLRLYRERGGAIYNA